MKTLKFTISFFIFIFSGTGYCLGSKPIMESPEEKRLKKKKIDKERELNKLRSSFKTLETENQRKKKGVENN